MSRTHVVALTDAIGPQLPICCRDCLFWQARRLTTDAHLKRRWASQFEERHGAWGRVLFDDTGLLGRLQYGPSATFPRARVLPAGPPAPEGALITCVYLAEDEAEGTLERLLLEALADLKARGFPSVDAFTTVDEDRPDAARHTLLHGTTLERLGFAPVRRRGTVALMRLELRGLKEGAEPRAGTTLLRPGPATATG